MKGKGGKNSRMAKAMKSMNKQEQDDAIDKKMGTKEGSPTDLKQDKKLGIKD